MEAIFGVYPTKHGSTWVVDLTVGQDVWEHGSHASRAEAHACIEVYAAEHGITDYTISTDE